MSRNTYQRPHVPRNIERKLWAESGGHCSNPNCRIYLFGNSNEYLGEIAHIKPHSEGGEASVDNLIILCRNCHRLHEPLHKPEEKKKLRQWKADNKKSLEMRFAVKCGNFNDLEEKIKPLLNENYQIFNNYGPDTNDPEAYKLWQKFEPKLISNNRKITLLLRKNINLLPYRNQEIVNKFEAHANEFEVTREDRDGIRQNLFPRGLLSLFGIEEEYDKLYYVSPLQNFIGKLQKENQFVSLSFFPPKIIYKENGMRKILNLEDGARVRQLFFIKYAYQSRRTEILFEHLQYTLKRLNQWNVPWKFENCSDLTVITINNTKRVKLLYSYVLSKAVLQETELDDVDYAANLYNWGGGGTHITEDAFTYGEHIGLKKIMIFYEFLEFCQK